MANTRRRTSGFDQKPTEVLEEVADSHEVESSVLEEKTFIEETIVPLDDTGPRFLEKEEVEVKVETPVEKKKTELAPRTKKNPRNVPRFSRTR